MRVQWSGVCTTVAESRPRVYVHFRVLLLSSSPTISYHTHTPQYTFHIPPQTPSGQYLLRVDVVVTGLTNSTSNTQYAQLYPSCAQINVQNDKSASALPKGVNFPEIMSPGSPGMQMSDEMGRMRSVDEGYVYPGGGIWDGEKIVVDRPDLGI
jgi:hypothetical protein